LSAFLNIYRHHHGIDVRLW